MKPKAVMLLGLIMNSSISRAWEDGAWWFVAPFLTSQLGHGIVTTISAPSRMLREHYAIMLGWIVASAPLWLIGAAAEETTRLWWWSAAAAIDLIGTWFAHPVPGRVLHSRNVAFAADHMIERCRLFLIIALGETVLTTGTALAQAPFGFLTAVTGSLSLLSIVSLWILYFGGSDHLVSEHVASTPDPIRSARLAMNGEVVVVAGLIALAVAQEIVIVHPRGHASATLSLLLFGASAVLAGPGLVPPRRKRTASRTTAGDGRSPNPRGRNLPGDAALRRSGAYDQPPRRRERLAQTPVFRFTDSFSRG
jgi:low temperature requirement protein LtrA